MKSTLAVAFIAVLCLSMLSASESKVIAQQSSGDWPMFHANPSRSGAGTGNPVLTPMLLWNYTTGDWVLSSPAVVNGVVYIGSIDGNIYALKATNGSQLWSYNTGNGVWSSPAVVGGVVYVGNDDNLYALNATSGAKLWNYTTNGVAGSPAVVGGVVYIGGGNNVYALGSSPNSSPSSWSSNALPIIVGVVAAVVIVATVILLVFKKRLKTKPTSPESPMQNSTLFSLFQYSQDSFAIGNKVEAERYRLLFG